MAAGPIRATSPRGVILAGGHGTRLLPATAHTNKHLLPLAGAPMILHPLRRLVAAGIDDILVVTGVEHAGAMVDCLGSGSRWGCSLRYRVQEEAGGVAQALGLARDFAAGGRVVVHLGDNIFEDPLAPQLEAWGEEGARILLKRVPDAHRFGVARFDDQGRLVGLVEKPQRPPSDLAMVGLYFFDARCFSFVEQLQPSWRGELEIVEVVERYRALGSLSWGELRGWWTDAGTPETLARADRWLRAREAR